MAYSSTLKVTIIHKGGEIVFNESSRRVFLDQYVQRTLRLSCKYYRVFWMDASGSKITIRNIQDLRDYLLAAGRQNQQAHIFVKRESKLRKFMKLVTRTR